MTKLVFMALYKGWFMGLGLHHACLALVPLGIGLVCAYFDHNVLGAFIASGGFWWYASREYGNGPYPPKKFEVMDFVSPAIVSSAYLVPGVYYAVI